MRNAEIIEELVDYTKERAIEQTRNYEISEWSTSMVENVYYTLTDQFDEALLEQYHDIVIPRISLNHLDEIGRVIHPRFIQDHYNELGLSQADFL